MSEKRKFCNALAGFAMGYLYVSCFLGGFTARGVMKTWYPLVFALAFVLWGAAIGRKRPQNPDARLWLGAVLLIAAALALNRGRAVEGWGVLALHGAAGMWSICSMGAAFGAEHPLFFLWDGLNAFLLLPFGNFFLRLRDLFRGAAALRRAGPEEKKRRKEIWIVLACLLLALPVLFWTAGLLAQADANFGAVLGKIKIDFRFQMPWWFVGKVLLGLPVAAYLYGLLAGAANRQPPDKQAAAKRLEGLQKLPPMAANAVWVMFIGLYLLFFTVQAGNLLAVFGGKVPGKLTAAEYARSGFFQLCLVMAINFILLELGSLFARVNPLGKGFSGILLVQSLFLAVTAGAKLWLYIARFGFTPLRLLSAWAVVVLSAGCILSLLSLAGHKNGFRNWLYFAVITFTILCFY